MAKKRVSTRLTVDEYDLINGQATKAGLSVSSYLKKKLFESKVKLTPEQLNQVLNNFSKRVDVMSLNRIQIETTVLSKTVHDHLTSDDQQTLRKIQYSLNNIEKGVDALCQLCM